MNHCKHSNKWKQDTAEKFILPINASHMVVEMAMLQDLSRSNKFIATVPMNNKLLTFISTTN